MLIFRRETRRRHPIAALRRKTTLSLLRLPARGIHPCMPVKPVGFTVAIGSGYTSSSHLALGHDRRTSLIKLFTRIGCIDEPARNHKT